MHTHPEPRITSAERLDGGVIITFDDGKSAVFSASLLYATLPQAEEITESELEDDEEALGG